MLLIFSFLVYVLTIFFTSTSLSVYVFWLSCCCHLRAVVPLISYEHTSNHIYLQRRIQNCCLFFNFQTKKRTICRFFFSFCWFSCLPCAVHGRFLLYLNGRCEFQKNWKEPTNTFYSAVPILCMHTTHILSRHNNRIENKERGKEGTENIKPKHRYTKRKKRNQIHSDA